MKRIDRLRKRMDDATDWAALAKRDGSWVAAATLLKAAEVFDAKLALLEIEQAATAKPTMTVAAEIAAFVDEVMAMPEASRESLLAHLTGSVN